MGPGTGMGSTAVLRPTSSRPVSRGALAERIRPVALAEEHLLAVLPALGALLPEEGLRRGTTVAVGGSGATTSLGLALAAGASRAGSWVAGVGLASLGVIAAAELGLALERFALVAAPPP